MTKSHIIIAAGKLLAGATLLLASVGCAVYPAYPSVGVTYGTGGYYRPGLYGNGWYGGPAFQGRFYRGPGWHGGPAWRGPAWRSPGWHGYGGWGHGWRGFGGYRH